MSLMPSESEATGSSIQKTDLKPSRPVDSPGFWWKLIDDLRRAVGMRSLELADRWAEAKVSERETDNEVKRGMAIASFEKTRAEVRNMDRDSETQCAFKEAETKRMHAIARQEEIKVKFMEITLHRLKKDLITPQEALDHLIDIQQKIETKGGKVNYQLPPPPSTDQEQSAD